MTQNKKKGFITMSILMVICALILFTSTMNLISYNTKIIKYNTGNIEKRIEIIEECDKFKNMILENCKLKPDYLKSNLIADIQSFKYKDSSYSLTFDSELINYASSEKCFMLHLKKNGAEVYYTVILKTENDEPIIFPLNY